MKLPCRSIGSRVQQQLQMQRIFNKALNLVVEGSSPTVGAKMLTQKMRNTPALEFEYMGATRFIVKTGKCDNKCKMRKKK